MGAEEEDGRILLETMLRAVAVMNVPVHDEDTRQPMFFLDVTSGDGHIVEQAKAHRPRGFSMMAGWPHRAKDVFDFSAHNGVNRRQRSPSGQKGGM